jgi:transposase-like protein
VITTKGHFPNEEAARKLIYLAISNATPAWTKTRSWTAALLAFKIHFEADCPNKRPTQKIGQCRGPG